MAGKIPAIYEKKIQNGYWTTKENQIQDDFKRGIGPEALYQMTRAEYKTDPDRIAIKDLIRLFNEYFLPKRNTYHNRGEFFWTKQTEAETREDFWRRLIEIKKRMQFREHNSRRITHIKIHDRNYGQETSGQINERKETRDEENDRDDPAKYI